MGVNPSIGLSFEYLRTVVSYVIIIMRSAVVVEAAKTAAAGEVPVIAMEV